MDGITDDEVRVLEYMIDELLDAIRHDPDGYEEWEEQAAGALKLRVRGQRRLRKLED